jgi:hypothetical protein
VLCQLISVIQTVIVYIIDDSSFITHESYDFSYNTKRYIYYNSLWYLMEGIKITTLIKRPTKKGGQYYFNIPIEYIRSGKINPEKEYELQIFTISSKYV